MIYETEFLKVQPFQSYNNNYMPYRGKFSSGKNFVTSEKLVTFPRLIIQTRHFSPTNF